MRWCFIHVTVKLGLGNDPKIYNESCITNDSSFPPETVRSENFLPWDRDFKEGDAQRISHTRCVILSFSRWLPLLVFSWCELLPESLIQTTNVIPKLDLLNRLLIYKLLISIKIEINGSSPIWQLLGRNPLCIFPGPTKIHNRPWCGNLIFGDFKNGKGLTPHTRIWGHFIGLKSRSYYNFHN